MQTLRNVCWVQESTCELMVITGNKQSAPLAEEVEPPQTPKQTAPPAAKDTPATFARWNEPKAHPGAKGAREQAARKRPAPAVEEDLPDEAEELRVMEVRMHRCLPAMRMHAERRHAETLGVMV